MAGLIKKMLATAITFAPSAGLVSKTVQAAVVELAGKVSAIHSEPYIYIRDEKATGSSGGSFAGGAWRTRTLNTKVRDDGGMASLSVNQITLPAGTYRVRARAPGASIVGAHKLRMRNVTDGVTVGVGANACTYADPNKAMSSDAMLVASFTIAASKVFELQHFCTATDGAGFGLPVSSGESEVFAEVEIWKEF